MDFCSVISVSLETLCNFTASIYFFLILKYTAVTLLMLQLLVSLSNPFCIQCKINMGREYPQNWMFAGCNKERKNSLSKRMAERKQVYVSNRVGEFHLSSVPVQPNADPLYALFKMELKGCHCWKLCKIFTTRSLDTPGFAIQVSFSGPWDKCSCHTDLPIRNVCDLNIPAMDTWGKSFRAHDAVKLIKPFRIVREVLCPMTALDTGQVVWKGKFRVGCVWIQNHRGCREIWDRTEIQEHLRNIYEELLLDDNSQIF